jgi:hypothetical protein
MQDYDSLHYANPSAAKEQIKREIREEYQQQQMTEKFLADFRRKHPSLKGVKDQDILRITASAAPHFTEDQWDDCIDEVGYQLSARQRYRDEGAKFPGIHHGEPPRSRYVAGEEMNRAARSDDRDAWDAHSRAVQSGETSYDPEQIPDSIAGLITQKQRQRAEAHQERYGTKR